VKGSGSGLLKNSISGGSQKNHEHQQRSRWAGRGYDKVLSGCEPCA